MPRARTLLLALALVLAACQGAETTTTTGGSDTTSATTAAEETTTTTAPPEAASIVIALATEPSTLDAQLVNDRSSRVVTSNIVEGLLFRDQSGEIVPNLAESYEAIADDRWQFTLRQGVTFHNGEPFNADAVVFSIMRIIAEDYETQRTSYIDGLVGAEAVDEYTVDILTDGISPVVPSQMTSIPIVPPGAGSEAGYGDAPVGTGPYQFVSWDRGQQITLEAYDGYWGDAPAIQSFSVRFIPDAQTSLAALQAGEVDMVLDLLPEQAALVPVFVSTPGPEFSYIQLNTYKEYLADPRVRQALNYAIDKDTLAATIYEGHARPNDAQHLTSSMLGYNDDVDAFPYDPEKAMQLLADAGYADGFSMELHIPIGRFLKGNETAEFVVAQLGEVGVTVEIVSSEFSVYREIVRIPGPDPASVDSRYAWNSNEWFDAARFSGFFTCEGGSSKICIDEIDALHDQASSTNDQEVRDQLYQQIWSILRENPLNIYLLQQNLLYGLSERLVWEPRADDEVLVSFMSLNG